MSDADLKFKTSYEKLNYSYNNKLVYQLTDRGLGSELNNLLLTALYCLVNKKQLVINDSNWKSGSFENYFEPFCNNFQTFVKIPNYIFSDGGKKRFIYKKLHNLLYPKYQLMDSSVWKKIHDPLLQAMDLDIPNLDFAGTSFNLLFLLEKSLLQYNSKTKAYISERLAEQNWSAYSGLHVRRGDKLIREASFFHIKDYLIEIKEKGENLNRLFIATDSYHAIRELEDYDESISYFSYCEPVNIGHDQKTFNNQLTSYKEKQVILLLLEIEILSQTKCFVGTFSSNIGRLVHLKRNGLNSYSLDADWFF